MDSSMPSAEIITSAYNKREPIEGTIKGANSGGWLVDVMGIEAFLPKSHFNKDNRADSLSFVGKKYPFIIIELVPSGLMGNYPFNRFIVSYFCHQFRDVTVGSSLKGKVLFHSVSGIAVLTNGIQLFIQTYEIPSEKALDLRRSYPKNSFVSFEVVKIIPKKAVIEVSINSYLASLKKEEERKRAVKKLAANMEGGEEFDAEVKEISKDGVNLLLENGIPGFIPKDELRYGFSSVASEAFVGEKRKVVFIKEEDGVFICSAKLLEADPYDPSLYDLDCGGLLSTLGIRQNSFLGQVIKGRNGVMLFVNLYADSTEDNGQLLVDPIKGVPIKVIVPAKVHNRFTAGNYYRLSLSVTNSDQRKKDRTPYRFYVTEKEAVQISSQVCEDPYKKLVERSFFQLDSPKSNASLINLIDEMGGGLYDYQDRMFFELLQNADDASAKAGVQVILQSIDGFLLLSHNGMPFNKKDYNSITSAARSNKGGDKGKTGYKGIGFKSVFTDSKQVYLKTGGFFFRFDKENEIFDDFDRFYFKARKLKDPKAQKEFLEENRDEKEDFRQVDSIPWQLLPFWVDYVPESLRNSIFASQHNVSIALAMSDVNRQKYIEAILGVLADPKFMLFLRHTNRIQFIDKNHDFVLSKKVKEGIIVLQSTNPEKEVIRRFLVKEGEVIPVNDNAFQVVGVDIRIKTIKKPLKDETCFVDRAEQKIQAIPPRIAESTNTIISYAISVDEGGEYQPLSESHSMYAYLPMVEKRFPFPIYINADFVLKSNRQAINNDNPWNHFLMYHIGASYVTWIAKEASVDHPNYLNLLPTEYFNESDVDMMYLSRYFNRAYKKALENDKFILNDRNEVVSQSEIILDTTGLYRIITADQFCWLVGQQEKRLPHPSLDVSVLAKPIFDLITRVDDVKVFLAKEDNLKYIREWIRTESPEHRAKAYQWVIKQGDLDLVKRLPLFAFEGRYRSLNEVDESESFLFLDSAFNGIRSILSKIGFICTDQDIQSHPLYPSFLKEALLAGNRSKQIHRIIVRSQKRVAILTPEEKVQLYKSVSEKCHTDNSKLECSQWKLFCNSDNVPCALDSLMEAGTDTNENLLFSASIIYQKEYALFSDEMKKQLMSRDRIYQTTIVNDWNSLVEKWQGIGLTAGWTEDDYAKIYGIVQGHYQSYHNNNPNEVIQTIAKIEQANYILSGKTFLAREGIFYSPNLSDAELRSAANKMLNINIPAESALPYLAKDPFITAHKNWTTQPQKENVVLSDEETLAVLKFCKDNNENFFEKNVISCVDEGNKIESKKASIQFFSDEPLLTDFVQNHLDNAICLPLTFRAYSHSEGLLSGESLFDSLFAAVDLSEYKETLLDFVLSQNKGIKEKFISALGQINLNGDDFSESGFYKRLFSLCSDLYTMALAKVEVSGDPVEFLPNRSNIQITYLDDNSVNKSKTLSSIPLQGVVSIGERSFDMDDLNPLGLQAFQQSARGLLAVMRNENISETYLKRLFDLDASINPDSVFASLNNAKTLENGSQLAFMLYYIINRPSAHAGFLLAAKNKETFDVNKRKWWYLYDYSFLQESMVLSERYAGFNAYLSEKGFETIPLELRFIGAPDTFDYLKPELTDTEKKDLLDYMYSKWAKDNAYWEKNAAIEKVALALSINRLDVVVSSDYSLPSESLPDVVVSWSNDVKETDTVIERERFLLTVFSLFGEESTLVKARRYISSGEPFDVPEDGSITKHLQDKICDWISQKMIILSEPQYTCIKRILDKDHITDSVDISLINKVINGVNPVKTINHFNVYSYPGIIPRHVCLCSKDGYEFYSYEEGDYCVDGYRVIVSENGIGSLRDLFMKIAMDSSNSFSSDDFLAFMSDQKSGRQSTDEEYNDLKQTCEALENEIRKYRSIIRLSSVDMASAEESYRGLDPDQMADALKEARRAVRNHLRQLNGFVVPDEDEDPNDWTTIKGVKWNGEDVIIIVRSYRSTEPRSFELNPDEWIKLMEGNAMLWIYTRNGPECFPFRDLVKNKSRINLSFSTINTDYPRRMLALAEVLRYFKSLNFDFGPGLPRGHSTAQRFIKPEKELCEALKEDDEDKLFGE